MEMETETESFKASKTLLGIETLPIALKKQNYMSFKASKTLLGIETATS